LARPVPRSRSSGYGRSRKKQNLGWGSVANSVVAAFDRKGKLDHHAHRLSP
jgi:hypothetical protein